MGVGYGVAGSLTPGAQLGTPTTAPGGLAGLAASGTPTPRLEEGPRPAPAEDSQAGDQSRSSEPGLGARGSSWGHATAPSLQLVQTGLGRVRPWQAACQASGVLPAPGSPQELGTGGRALGHSQAPPSRQEIVPQSVPFVENHGRDLPRGSPGNARSKREHPNRGPSDTLASIRRTCGAVKRQMPGAPQRFGFRKLGEGSGHLYF